MDKQKLVNEIQHFQMYLSTIISNLRLNAAICDFYENDTKSFNRYGICLGNISDALNYRQHMLCYLLFFDDKESKSIPKFLRRVQDTKIVSDKAIDLKLKKIATDVCEKISEIQTDLDSLFEFRYNVYAHWNPKLFESEWQKKFSEQNKFDYEKIINLCNYCFSSFSEMLTMLNEEAFTKAVITQSSIDSFIKNLKR